MRKAKSYSIVDHALLHNGYLRRLSHPALSLYLFLCVVGDRDGRSFYSDRSVCEILRFAIHDIAKVRAELIATGLIDYSAPYWLVKSLSQSAGADSAETYSPPCTSINRTRLRGKEPCSTPAPIRGVVPEALRALIRSLEGQS